MEQGGNNDEEGTTESANKNLPKHDLSNNIREMQNIQKSMVKKKRGRQCLPMARRQCKEEMKRKHS